MTADEFPLRFILNLNVTIDLGLSFNKFFETYILKQLLKILVVARDVGSERRLVVILLQNPVGGITV